MYSWMSRLAWLFLFIFFGDARNRKKYQDGKLHPMISMSIKQNKQLHAKQHATAHQICAGRRPEVG